MSRARFHAITTNKLYQLLFILFIAVLGAYIIVFFSVIKPILVRKSNTGYTTQQLETNNGQAKTIDPASPTPATSPTAQKSSASNPNQTPSSNTAPQPTAQATSPATVAAPVCDEAKKAQGLANRNSKLASSQATLDARIAEINKAYNTTDINWANDRYQKTFVVNTAMVEFYARNSSANSEYDQLLVSINCK